jgi:hypothetical protein
MSKNNVLNDFFNHQEHFEINKQDLNAKIMVVILKSTNKI